MRKTIWLAVALAVLVPGVSGHGGQRPVRTLMQRKLDHAQKVLEGVAVNDFPLIVKNAEELVQLSKLAEWRVLPTPQYESHSLEFRRTAEGLAKAARDKNTDGAALAYVEMTLTCVKCHKHVREVRVARLD